jgi:hypothetical protein
VAFPVTVVPVPTVVPPVVQVVGADVCGPKTLKVIVPLAFEPELAASVEVIEPSGMAVPTVPLEGPVAVTVGDALATTVSDMPDPQALDAVLLFVSPP